MVKKVLAESITLLHIILFVYINVLYIYVALRVWRKKTDRIAKLILLLFYITFSVDFLEAVFDNSDEYTMTILSVTCYIILQLGFIIFLE
jgi:4-amino-4-deoxy-L-arabinose transferase-like glycosyltransferase